VSQAAANLNPENLGLRPASRFGGVLFLGISLILIALNMRDLTTSVAAVLPEAMRATNLSVSGASILTAIPVLCFGVFGPAAALLSQRFGIARALLIALTVLTVGTGMRGFGTLLALFTGQILSGGAIGVLNVLLPAIVKRDFPNHVGLMTGLYTMATCLGAAITAATTVPLMGTFGGSWMGALAFWSLPAALATIIWIMQMRSATATRDENKFAVRGLWLDPLAWQVAAFMGLQSSFAYIVFGWLAPILRDRGIDAAHAGFIVLVCVVAQAVGCLVSPPIAVRVRNQRLCNVIAVALLVTALVGCVLAPLWTVFFWAVFMGLSQGAIFALAITVIVLRSPNVQVATHLSGMSQTVGYLIACGGALFAGLLRDWTGSWTSAAYLFVGLGVVAAFFGFAAGRPLYVRAEVIFRNPNF
jgi:MFS transporter, CP family, cyanate transporter